MSDYRDYFDDECDQIDWDDLQSVLESGAGCPHRRPMRQSPQYQVYGADDKSGWFGAELQRPPHFQLAFARTNALKRR